MRLYLAFGVLLSIACGCAMHDRGQNSVRYSPPIIITLRGIQVSNDCHIASFEIRNVSEEDMWFPGNRRGCADYCVQRELSIGGWDPEPTGSDCPMDSAMWRVAAGSSRFFPVYFWSRQQDSVRYRVGVWVYPSESPRPSAPEIVYWSEPISP
jgi:hypothetical protein